MTTFQRILDVYSVGDPALEFMGTIIVGAVDHVLQDELRTQLEARDPLVGGVLAIAEGTMLISTTDNECLAKSLPIYEALYARLKAQLEIERVVPSGIPP